MGQLLLLPHVMYIHQPSTALSMKKEIVKRKLTFKKAFLANLNHDAANEILGGGGTTFSDTPCICSHTCNSNYSCMSVAPGCPDMLNG
jgi:hypothetical protein